MKSEERHKLHQNALAVWLQDTAETVKPYQNFIIVAAIVLIVAIIAMMWWTNESAAQANKAWTEYFIAIGNVNPAALLKVAEDNSRSRAAPAAYLAAGDIQLAQGCNMLFINKARANQQLNQAADLYQMVFQQTKSPILCAQAMYGLARAQEAEGKLDIAEKIYTELTTNWPDTIYAKMATQRLQDLKRKSTKEAYDRFAQFDPKPEFSKESGEKQGIDKIPEETPISQSGDTSQQATEEKKEQKAEIKTEENKPADTQQVPGAEKPVETQPSTGADKPAS
jgi:hypothetical protein